METRAESTRGLAVKLTLAILAIAVVCFYVSGLYVGGTRGTVGIVENIEAPQEAWRIAPAENVDVLILWQAKEMKAVLPFPRCLRAVLMRTNANGDYSIGSWWLAPSWPPRIKAYEDVYVSKPGHLPIVDRSRLAPNQPYTHILGPPAINPWTGLVLPDESPLRPTHDRDCPPVERM